MAKKRGKAVKELRPFVNGLNFQINSLLVASCLSPETWHNYNRH